MRVVPACCCAGGGGGGEEAPKMLLLGEGGFCDQTPTLRAHY